VQPVPLCAQTMREGRGFVRAGQATGLWDAWEEGRKGPGRLVRERPDPFRP